MAIVFTQFFFQHLAGAFLFFPIVWLFMRKVRGQKLKVGFLWLVIGLLSTALGASIVRFASMFIIGGKYVIAPVEGYSAFFFIAAPVLSAIGACLLLRKKAQANVSAENA